MSIQCALECSYSVRRPAYTFDCWLVTNNQIETFDAFAERDMLTYAFN